MRGLECAEFVLNALLDHIYDGIHLAFTSLSDLRYRPSAWAPCLFGGEPIRCQISVCRCLMALIDKIISESWVRARLHGVLVCVLSDIWILGEVGDIKESKNVGVLSGSRPA